MLKLTKSVSNENYPLSPQTSSVRKLTLTVQPSNPVDLGKSYLLVKNTLSTTLRGQGVVRNVGWGSQLAEDKTVMYPNSVQIRTASLSVDGSMVEYSEDLNIRIVNLDGYSKGCDELRKLANVGKYGFQRVEGHKIAALDGSAVPMMDGHYLSPFVDRPVDADGHMTDFATYKELPGVIHLSDIFEFCASAGQLNLAGRTVKIELQFEDRFELLAEVLNYPCDQDGNAPTTRDDMTFPLAAATATLADGDPIDPAALPADPEYKIDSIQTFRAVSEVPFYVGQPVAFWLNQAQPAQGGQNIGQITQIHHAADTGIATIYFKKYNVGGVITSNGAAVTDAVFVANIWAAGAGVCVGMTGVYDPKLVAGGNDQLTWRTGANSLLGAGIASTYQITGIECVMCEVLGQSVPKKTVEYLQFNRDMDTIAAGQTYYQKSFPIDPMCVAAFAVAPPAKIAGARNQNMWWVSEQFGVSSGVSFRNLMNGQQLYSHDIVFSRNAQNVEPLHLDRMEMAFDAIEASQMNMTTTQQLVVTDGTGQHCLIAEAVPMSEPQQQFQVRLSMVQNTDPRTIYLFKAVVKSATL